MRSAALTNDSFAGLPVFIAAMGRAHRIGQTRPVTVYRLVTKGTVEERIVALHQDKRALAESILAEGDAALLASADDLVALIRGE